MTMREFSRRIPMATMTMIVIASAALPAQDPALDAQPTPSAAPVLEENPLLKEPRTPQTLMDAVVLMTDLARPGLARMYLEKLLEANPDDETLLQIRDKHGPALLLKLSNDKNLQPDSITLLERINAAFRKGATDPTRVDRLIGELGKTAAEREVAILQLRNAGTYAAARILRALNVSRDDSQKKVLLYTLTRLNREVVPVLLGAVEGPGAELRATVIEALGWLGDPQAINALWHPAFEETQSPAVRLSARQSLARLLFGDVKRIADVTPFGAVRALETSTRRLLRDEVEWPLNDDGQVELWNWNDASGTVDMEAVTPRTASIRAAVRQSRQAFELAPERSELQTLYWTALMASELHVAGRGGTFSTEPGSTFHIGLQMGPEAMQAALVEALSLAEPQVAAAALEALTQTGSERMLKPTDGRPAPVVAALNYPDPRVQLAAASTILTWDPQTSFRGGSRVVEVLARALSDSGTAHGIAIDANAQRGTSMSTALRQMGFEPELAQTGQEGFKIASQRGDIGLILIEANVARWELSQTIANLRADARTAYIPIVVYGDEMLRDRIERVAERYPRVGFVMMTNDPAIMSQQVQRALRNANPLSITQQQRSAMRTTALNWLTHLANRRKASLFDLAPAEAELLAAANDPDLGDSAVFVLGAIGTPSAQAKLFELASSTARPVSIRERAAAQLVSHIQHHSLLLTELQVDELRKAARQATEPELQTAFAAVLGALQPNLARSREVLKTVPRRMPVTQ